MITFSKMHDDLNKSGNPCSYWGEHGDWLVAMGRHRDSDILTNCNWDVFVEMLDALGDDAYTIESENHWAVGWVEHLLINPACEVAVYLAKKVQNDLENYPVLSDDAFSEAELEAFEQSWSSWGASELRKELVEQFELNPLTASYLEDFLDDVDDGVLADWWLSVCCEPYYCTNEGCSIPIECHVNNMDRDDLATLLRHCRQAKVAS